VVGCLDVDIFWRNFGRRRDWFVGVGHVHILLFMAVEILRMGSTALAELVYAVLEY
jgi:hypothetical protein